MKNKALLGIFFFLFLLTASGVFAAMVENLRQGSLAISVTSQPGSAENAAETHQGLTCVILNPVSVGAFISKDPIGFNGGMNLYRYADNNPIIYTDPSGLIWVFDGWLGWDHTQISYTGGYSGAGWQTYYYVRYLDMWKATFVWVENPLCNPDPSTPVGTTRAELWPRFKLFEGPHFLTSDPFHSYSSPDPTDQASGKFGHTELSPPLPHY